MFVLAGQRGLHYTNGVLDYVEIRVRPENPQALRHLFWLLDGGFIDFNGAAAVLAFKQLVDASDPQAYNVVKFRIKDWWRVPSNSVGWIGRIIGRSMIRRYERWCAQKRSSKKGGRL
jgi:hypothetical protein